MAVQLYVPNKLNKIFLHVDLSLSVEKILKGTSVGFRFSLLIQYRMEVLLETILGYLILPNSADTRIQYSVRL